MSLFNKIQRRISRNMTYRREMRKFKRMITEHNKELKEHHKLTKEQKREVQEFYKSMIGKEIPLYCHEYFYSRTGYFTKEYVPNNLYHVEILPRANDFRMIPALNDKNMCDIQFPGENIAPSIIKNINGYYYHDGNQVSKEEAESICSNVDHVVIKPSQESKGHGVRVFSSKDGVTDIDGKRIGQIFDEYKRNFLVQPWIKQHKDMAALNPSSVNTLRILTYHSGMEVLLIYTVVRIGRSGSVIDNQCAGGISTAVDANGRLAKMAYGGYSDDNIATTDTGIILDGYQIPSYDKAVEFVKRLHSKSPYFNIIGWDVAIQEDGNPILIELNCMPGLSQSAFRSGMGEHTERIIRETWPKRNTRY